MKKEKIIEIILNYEQELQKTTLKTATRSEF
jgi:hypothetical protein